MLRAEEMMLQTDESVGYIAGAPRLSDEPQLTRLFRRMVCELAATPALRLTFHRPHLIRPASVFALAAAQLFPRQPSCQASSIAARRL